MMPKMNGFGKMKEIIENILDNIKNIYIVAICGNNEQLYYELQKIKNPNLIINGVGIIRKPLIHIMPIPGVENYNANFFYNNGISYISKNVEEVLDNVQNLSKDKNTQNEMILNQSKIINRNSANQLVSFIKNNF